MSDQLDSHGDKAQQRLIEQADAKPFTTKMGLSYINAILATLPSYTEVVANLSNARPQRLMARDLPGSDRRFTNLNSGMEWFLPLSENLGVLSVEIPAITVEVIN